MCLSQKLLNHYPIGTPGAYCSYDADGFLVDSISQNNVWDSTVIQRVHPTNRQFETQDHVTEWFSKFSFIPMSVTNFMIDLYEEVFGTGRRRGGGGILN